MIGGLSISLIYSILPELNLFFIINTDSELLVSVYLWFVSGVG